MRIPALLFTLVLLASTTACGGTDEETPETNLDESIEQGMEPEPEPVPADEPQTGDEDLTVHRPAEITLTISGQEMYAGTYTASGTSRTCGPQTYMPGQVYGVQFPYEGEFKVRDLSFTAQNLAAGGSTDQFHLSLGLETPSGSRPPSFTVRAGSDPQESGTATLTSADGTDTLVVEGRTASATFEMTVICRPKSG